MDRDHHISDYIDTPFNDESYVSDIEENLSVTGNVKDETKGQGYAPPPQAPDGPTLEAARPLPLSLVPKAPEAIALVETIYQRVLAYEASGRRQRQRGKSGREDLRAAVGAFAGGLLTSWSASTPRLASSAVRPGAFSGRPVGYRVFTAVKDALIGLGLVAMEEGKRFARADFDGPIWDGRVSRFWPTAELLSLAEAHGLLPRSVKSAFRRQIPTEPPTIAEPVVVRAFKPKDRRQSSKAATLTLDADDPEVRRISEDVEAHNAFAASSTVEGCIPPRWRRIFTADLRLHGRWYAAGAEASCVYQNMPEDERLREIRIGGEAVVEVDVSAAHLTILHGLHGLPLPAGDPYAVVEGVPREIVKAWLTASIGRGKAKPSWSDRATEEQRAYDAALICGAMLEAYPFLADLPSIVPADLREAHKRRRGLVSHFLMGVEAAALTGAMAHLRAMGILALPTHDGLIVQASAEGWATASLEAAFSYFARVQPRLKVARMPGKCR